MNLPEQMYTDIKDMLPQLQEALINGTNYATSLGHRVIQYLIVGDIFLIVLFMFVNFVFYKLYKLSIKNNWDYNIKDGINMCLIISSVVNFVMFIFNITDIIKCIFVPEIVLIHYITNLF